MVHLRTLFGASSDLENIQRLSMLDALTLRKCVCFIFINYLDVLSKYTRLIVGIGIKAPLYSIGIRTYACMHVYLWNFN